MKNFFNFGQNKEAAAPETAVKKAENNGKKSRIVIKYDVGMNNAVYIRGQGGDLSWAQGKLLKNVGPDEWIWECDEPFKSCEFKVLINDQWYETGDNHTLKCGTAIQYTPHF